MKKIIIAITASLALTVCISNALSSTLNTSQDVSVATNSPENKAIISESTGNMLADAQPQVKTESAENASTDKSADASSTSSEEKTAPPAAKADTKKSSALSRGGNAVSTKRDTYDNTKSKSVSSSKYGELLTWNQADNLIPRGTTIQVTDLNTGKTFNIKRTFGTNHIDGEALSLADTKIIKSIWGGFSWERRPVIVSINGRRIAASMTAMPHAGVDSAPAVNTVSNRSGGYGTGENLDAVKNNGMDGVIDIHFLNSTRHKDNKSDPQHQTAILKAAGK